MLARGFKTRGENMSLQLRRELNLRSIDPLSPIDLANHLNVAVWKPEDVLGFSAQARGVLLGKGKDEWSAVTITYGGTDIIVHNSSHSPTRQSSDLMHELSHILLDHEPSKMLFSKDIKVVLRDFNQDQEDEASWLSGCLLLPREALLFIRRTRMNTTEACRRYAVSHELLTYRMNMTGVNYQLGTAR